MFYTGIVYSLGIQYWCFLLHMDSILALFIAYVLHAGIALVLYAFIA